MMYTVNNKRVQYGIAHGNHLVDVIMTSGAPGYSSNPLLFETYNQAADYLEAAFSNCLRMSTAHMRVPEIMMQYHIVQHVTDIQTYGGPVHMYAVLLDKFRHQTEVSEYSKCMLVPMFIDAIRHGFRVLGINTVQDAEQLISDPKYKELFDDILPMHVRENLDRFIQSGTKTCSDDDKGAIIFTSTEEMLNRIEFDFK